jgi:hypothetical protein
LPSSKSKLCAEPVPFVEAKRRILFDAGITYIPVKEEPLYLMRNHKFSIPAIVDAVNRGFIEKGAQQFLFDFHNDVGEEGEAFEQLYRFERLPEGMEIEPWVEYARECSREGRFNVDLVKAGFIAPGIVVVKKNTTYKELDITRNKVGIHLTIISFAEFLTRFARAFVGRDPKTYFSNTDLDMWTEGGESKVVDIE